jgi:hypothetical protein
LGGFSFVVVVAVLDGVAAPLEGGSHSPPAGKVTCVLVRGWWVWRLFGVF